MKVRSLRRRFYRKNGYHYWGYRCKVYCAGCVVCEAWKFLDTHGRFPSFEETDELSIATSMRMEAI